jgi:type VI secretion system protein VasD
VSARAFATALLAAGAGALASALGAGCGSTPPPAAPAPKVCDTQRVSLSILASHSLNPTLDDEPRPVVLRIYQLKSDVRFQSASFEEVWKNDATVLSDDLVNRDEVFVFPETRTNVKFERDPAAESVVVAALFRNPVGRRWYAAYDLPPMPGKGDCRTPECEGDVCAVDRANPRFALWVEGTQVDDGAGHEDELPAGGRRVRLVQLFQPGAAASASAPATSRGGR